MTDSPHDLEIKMLKHNIRRLSRMLGKTPMTLEALEKIFSPETIEEKGSTSVSLQENKYAELPKKGRAAIVCWDLGHNPVGRAIIIYDLLAKDWDVELIGPIWEQFGTQIWGPIANSGRKVRHFHCRDLEDFYPAAVTFAETNPYDLVVACKPRAPSMALAALIKKQSKCPLLLDADDLELTFADKDTPLTEKEMVDLPLEAFRLPYESDAIRYCENLTQFADSIIVSNIALRDHYGGHIVRHARDEEIFNPEHFDRTLARKRLGLKDEDFALMFVGTPRPHKGIYDIAEALHEMDDPQFVLNIVGNIDYPDMKKRLKSYKNARINLYPNCSFEELPGYLAAADAVPLMQDRDHEISQFQIPAKISDATAFGLPVMITEVPPIFDLEQQNILHVIHKDYIPETLEDLYEERESGENLTHMRRIRTAFESEFGFRVNRIRLDNAVREAQEKSQSNLSSFEPLLSKLKDAFLHLSRPKPVKPLGPVKGKKDLVMFWKQNDSGLFGRRSDMIMKHLLLSGEFGRILQIDVPVNLQELAQMMERGRSQNANETITSRNIIRNKFCLNDTGNHFFRTFIWSETTKGSELIDGTSLDVYPAFIEDQMAVLEFDPANTIAWVCPVVKEFESIAQRIPFSHLICDIIDDQRAFNVTPAQRREIEKNYEYIVPKADVVLTNCHPNVEAFSPLAKEIFFVPNGTEKYTENAEAPDTLSKISRPIAGYVGNLQDRIDWELLEQAVKDLPDVSFVIAGGGADKDVLKSLSKNSNIHFVGPIPYDQVQAFIQNFDVCLVPHKGTELTRRMNPLKVYNYFAAGKPIIATEIENIDGELNPYIRFAKNATEFSAYIKERLSEQMIIDEDYMKVLDGISWDSRINQISNILKSNLT